MVEVVGIPSSCAVVMISTHRAGRQFVGAQFLPYAIIEDFRGGARNAAQPFVLHHLQVVSQGHTCFQDAVIDFHGRECMHMHAGNGVLDSAKEVAVEKSVEVSRQSALNADFGGAAIPSLAGTAHYFFEREGVRVGGARAASEAAKTAADETNVSEIDVAIHDIGDGVADSLPTQAVRGGHECFKFCAFRGREDKSLFEGQLCA